MPPADPNRKVVVYPDHYTNYMNVERGKAAVRTLEALGAEAVVSQAPGSGRAPLSQGMIDTARSKATGAADELGSYVDAGYDIVVIEPSDVAMFTGQYKRLLPEAEFEPLAENSYDILEYIYGLVANGADISKLRHADGDTTVAYHSYCQQRTMGPEEHNRTILERYGCDVETNDVECGMAGSFGYNSQFYEQSVDVGENLVGQIRDPRPRCRCRERHVLSRPDRGPA